MSLSKMLLLPPETYSKLKENIADDANLSYLDRKMNKILKNQTLSSDKKWYMYRQMLNKYSIIKRKMIQKNTNVEPAKSFKHETKSSQTFTDNVEDDESDESDGDAYEEFVHDNELEFEDVPQRLSMSAPAKQYYNISGMDDIDDDDDDEIQVEKPQFQSSPKDLGEGGYRGGNDMSIDSEDDDVKDGAVGEDALEAYSTPRSKPIPFLIKPAMIPITPQVKSLKRVLDNSHSAPSPNEKKKLRNEVGRVHALRPRDEKGQAINWQKL